MLSWGEGSWTWAYFSLPAHHSKPTGSYSDDRNKAWPQSPAIQLHNPSTPTLSQKDNNVNILILPISLSLCNWLLAPQGRRRDEYIPNIPGWGQDRVSTPELATHQTGTCLSYPCLVTYFRTCITTEERTPRVQRCLPNWVSSPSPGGGGATIWCRELRIHEFRLVLLLFLGRQSWASYFYFPSFGFLM